MLFLEAKELNLKLISFLKKRRLRFDAGAFLCNYLSMLKKQFRLKKDSAFNATYKVKHSYHNCGVVLWVGRKKNDDKIPTKVGFVVSKKTHKRSVRRNRLKRLMRESYRLLLKENKIEKSQRYLSLIFVGLEKALDKDFDKMKNIIYNLLNNIKG